MMKVMMVIVLMMMMMTFEPHNSHTDHSLQLGFGTYTLLVNATSSLPFKALPSYKRKFPQNEAFMGNNLTSPQNNNVLTSNTIKLQDSLLKKNKKKIEKKHLSSEAQNEKFEIYQESKNFLLRHHNLFSRFYFRHKFSPTAPRDTHASLNHSFMTTQLQQTLNQPQQLQLEQLQLSQNQQLQLNQPQLSQLQLLQQSQHKNQSQHSQHQNKKFQIQQHSQQEQHRLPHQIFPSNPQPQLPQVETKHSKRQKQHSKTQQQYSNTKHQQQQQQYQQYSKAQQLNNNHTQHFKTNFSRFLLKTTTFHEPTNHNDHNNNNNINNNKNHKKSNNSNYYNYLNNINDRSNNNHYNNSNNDIIYHYKINNNKNKNNNNKNKNNNKKNKNRNNNINNNEKTIKNTTPTTPTTTTHHKTRPTKKFAKRKMAAYIENKSSQMAGQNFFTLDKHNINIQG